MKKNNLLNEKPKALLKDFINNYKSLYEVDEEFSLKLINKCIKHYQNKSKQPLYLKNLMKKWYDGLDKVEKNIVEDFNYSVYNDRYYFATDLWPCFVLYSRKYILGVLKNETIYNQIKKCNSIIDLGCGLGYSTAMLKQAFPNKEIIGTNLEDTEQYSFCEKMSNMYNFKIIESEQKINKNIDVVFASEYFEHIFDAPINIQRLIEKIKPKFLLLANTFSQKSVGHFNYYEYRNYDAKLLQFVDNKKTSKIFNNVLKRLGYELVKTGMWNNRPNFWRKK